MNLEEKRIKLFQDFRDDAIDNDFQSDFDKKYPTFDVWQNVNFKNEATVIALWNKALKNIIAPTSKENFFKTFACDILPTSKYCVQEGFPACASKMGKAETGYFGFGDTYIKYRSTQWDKPEILLFKSNDGKNGKYKINSGSKEGMTGVYTCTQSGKLFLNLPTGSPKKDETTPEKETPKTDQKKQEPSKEPETSKTTIPLKRSEKNTKISGSDAVIY